MLGFSTPSSQAAHSRGVVSRKTDAHEEDAFSVAGDLVLLASDHEGIIVLEQLQPLTLWLVSIPISRQRRVMSRLGGNEPHFIGLKLGAQLSEQRKLVVQDDSEGP